MKKGEIVELYKALNKTLSLPGARFQYGVNKNLNLLKSEIESLEKAIAPSEEFKKLQQDFEPERIKIAEKHSLKDSEGNPIKKMVDLNGQQVEIYDMGNDGVRNKASNEESEATMKTMNPILYDARLLQLGEYQEMLKEEVKIAFFPYQIKLVDVPEAINGIQMKALCDAGIIVEQ